MLNSSRNPIKILLVDDHKSFMDGLEMVINTQKPKMEVVGMAATAEEALKAAIQKKPDLILLDMDLGSDNSIDFLPTLLEKTDAKVLFLTGVRDPDIHDSAILKGARGVLLKGESAKVIIRAIEKVHNGEIWAANSTVSRVLALMNNGNKKKSPEEEKIAYLTPREREIINVLVNLESSTNEEIANQLFISVSTLKNHLTTIYSKLDVKNRVQLMKFALANNLSKPSK
jgi:two-component system, NarL family, nitrate/nitrite response regulator NarL